MPPKLKIPPNAKFQPQNPKYVGNDTGSKDPEDLRSRLFAGCLNLETCNRNDIIELFSMYGPIRSVTHFVKGGYAFIQFESAEDAEDAVLNLNRYMFQGIRLDVKLAQKDRLLEGQNFNRQGPNSRRPIGLGHGPPQKRRPNEGPPFRRKQGRFDYGGSDSNYQDQYNQDYEDEYSATGYVDPYAEAPVKRFGKAAQPRVNSKTKNNDEKNDTDGQENGSENGGEENNVDDSENAESNAKRADANELLRQRRIENIKKQIFENVEDEEGSVLDQNDIPDLFICGGCHLITSSLDFFYAHRLKSCDRKIIDKFEEEPTTFKCFHCDEPCKNSWELIMHIGRKHKTVLYKEHEPKTDEYPPLFMD